VEENIFKVQVNGTVPVHVNRLTGTAYATSLVLDVATRGANQITRTDIRFYYIIKKRHR
jgi:hypothetical protein